MWVGVRDVGGELAAARMSASTGLVHCRQGPPALPPLLSAGSAAAKKWLNKALFICADCIHCTSQLRDSGTTQICLALQRKGPADWSWITVCTEVPGWRSILSTLWQTRTPTHNSATSCCRLYIRWDTFLTYFWVGVSWEVSATVSISCPTFCFDCAGR